jgi:tRNA threonylcarbamoyladenosine biosynthesis protein TsaE
LSAARELRSESAAETEEIGARVAAGLVAGDTVLVSGELGAGKTTLIRGGCRALGYRGPVTSPTFTLGQRYRGRLPISHLDLFRLETLAGEDPALIEDYLTPDVVAFVEWPALAEPALDRVAIRVRIEHRGGDRRAIAVEERPQ